MKITKFFPLVLIFTLLGCTTTALIGSQSITPSITPSTAPTVTQTISPKPSITSVNNKSDNQTISILYYHSISDNTYGLKELFVSPNQFEKQMQYLKDNNYTVITFNDLDNVSTIEKPVIITFDDGYENNYLYAYPILKKYNFRATIFICTDFIDKPSFLSQAQIKQMCDYVNFQSHTLTHPNLTKIGIEQLKEELVNSKNIIQNLTTQKVNVFAYPTGYYNQTVLDLVKNNYDYAVLNYGGIYKNGDNKYLIKRIYIERNRDIYRFEKLLKYGKR